MTIWWLLAIAVGINLAGFLVAYKYKSDKLTDFSYGATFFIVAEAAYLYHPYSITSYSLPAYISLSVVAVWALRIAFFLLRRILATKKDRRFDGVRESFFKFGRFWLFQGITAWIILLPSLFVIINHPPKFIAWSSIGIAVAFVGMLIESIADSQKFAFTQDPKNRGKFISTGLWKYSRHPNYFGEICVWIGVYIYSFTYLSSHQRLIGVVSPLYIAFLLIFVTGLPKLESYADKKWGGQKDYQQYKKTTPVLVPFIKSS